MNLVLVEASEVTPTAQVTLRDGRATHLRTVLHVTPGQSVRIGVVDGPIGTGVVQQASADGVVLACTWGEPPPRPRVDLLLALPRPKVLRRLWAQFAALGVGQIILTNAERVERNYFDTHVLDESDYRPLLIEGLQQARDTHVPRVSVHRQFRVLVEDTLDSLTADARRLVAEPGDARGIRAALAAQAADEQVLLAVGPEGGWNAFELTLLHAHRFTPVSLGPRTLRSDTACLALLTLVHDAIATS